MDTDRNRMTPIEHLMAALRADAQPEAWFASLNAANLPSDELVVTAWVLGLGPLLHYRLEAWGRALPDSKAQAKLNFIRQSESARQSALRAQLGEVLARLPSPPIVLKGAYLAEKIYPAPGLRPMNDIDLLFRPEDLLAVSRVLHELGYASKEKSPDLGPSITKHTRTFKRQIVETPRPRHSVPGICDRGVSTSNPYLSVDANRMIEPHRSLEESWFGLKCDLTPGMWERSLEIQIAGQRARALSPEDNLLHIGVHLAFHLIMGAPSFVQLMDVAMIPDQCPVEWGDFLTRARALRASGYAYAALRLAAQVLAAPVPLEVLQTLAADCPRTVRAAAESLSLADLIRRTQKPPLRTISQRLKRGVQDRVETARWAHSFREWLDVWWTLIDVRRTDTWRMLAGAKG
jgi:hypothetical protein